MRQTWAQGGAGWVEHETIFDAVFAPVTAAILERDAPAPGLRLLDVGCGSGTLLEAGARAGADVVGVDISPVMARAARARVPSATVLVADAQSADLLVEAPGEPFDRVVSRFGVMFFDEPAAAFANLRRCSAPGARLVFACWRGVAENPSFTAGTELLVARMDPRPEPPPPGAPGPMAFADGERLRGLLTAAGWGSVAVDPFDFTGVYGSGDSDGVAERMAVILSTSGGRLARAQLEPRLGEEGWASLLEEVRAEVRTHLVDGVVQLPGATWLVSATNS
ncbi:methyltransferase domain-containing protein [Ornithinicoccus hortensis]|uniref:Methyltransferase family protein n=2 Tax=Ornithinicoccus hortensis TaxID=82346 RepID=A0A542YLW3_9MICO|nr:methyltransferase family protein [Ornithinicoccus hortensis]